MRVEPLTREDWHVASHRPEPRQLARNFGTGSAFVCALTLTLLQAAPAWATQPCPPGTAGSIVWRLAPLGALAVTVLVVCLTFKYVPGVWRYLVALPVVLLGLAIALLLFIVPGPCVR